MKALDAYRRVLAALPPEITAAEAEAEREAAVCVTLRGGVRQDCAASDVTELFLRAGGTRTGFAYTQNLEEEPLAVLRRAYENGLYAAADAPEPMRGPTDGPRDGGAAGTDPALLWEKAGEIDRHLAARLRPEDSRTLTVTGLARDLGLVNTRGCEVCGSSRTFLAELLVVRPGCASLRVQRSFGALPDVQPALFDAALDKWEACQLPAADFTPGAYPCVLDSSVMTNILLTSWQMFTAQGYLHHGTPYAGKLGQTAASPVLQIVDRPESPESGFCFPVDAEGTPGREVTLVRDGVLCGLMHNLTTAAAMGAEPTGNAGRKALLSGNLPTVLGIIPRNFAIAPGQGSLWQLLEAMGDGVYICESFDEFHSINVASGDYSIPCNGVLVQGGRMAGRVEGLTITGTVQGLLSDVRAVAADTAVLPMEMLRSYTVAAPSVWVSRLQLSR
ncbi:MAG: TldD/PmbA family protein [Oscillospiraceae bacterium]|nr:TldD/PmbA family protein [Oscillospiraceae bacterium]